MNIEQMEQAASDCLSELAGVDTYDVDLRDHTKAWKAIEHFAALVRAQALEEAATEARQMLTAGRSPLGDLVAKAIRALKASPDAVEG